MRLRVILAFVVAFPMCASLAMADEPNVANGGCFDESVQPEDGSPARRREQYCRDFAYFVYPIVGSVPGLGSATGGGATLANIGNGYTDFTGFYVDGDFTAAGATLLDIHIIEKLLVFNTGAYAYKVAPKIFRRGIDSDTSDYILPFFEGNSAIAQLALTFDERRREFYIRWVNSSGKLSRLLDKYGNEFSNADKSLRTENALNIGFTLDITDDQQDPRKGWRVEGVRRSPMEENFMMSKFDTYDLNLTGYLPMGSSSTWAFNAFYSAAVRQSAATTDRAVLKEAIGLQCAEYTDPSARAACEAAESQFLDDRIAYNEYGIATPLGGTQRLRSYPNGRFFGGKSVSYGTEFRWNLTEERTMMDWVFLRGLRTNLQAAFFAEAGSVADEWGDLHSKFRYSYGAGFRALLSGVTLRLDVGFGDEGMEAQFFLDYPWSVFSIDRPG